MPRNPRLTYKDGFYHIFNRGHNKNLIFRDDHDYLTLLSKIRQLIEAGDWVIYAFCLMPNHYHFLVEEKNTPVAKFIGRLFTSYSLYFNKKYKRNGTLFQDRFKSKIIQKENYFFTVSRYIHLNPYISGITKDPAKYPYSSLREYSGRIANKIVNFEKVSSLIGKSKKNLDDYLKFIREGIEVYKKNGMIEDYNPFENENEIVGSSVFITNRKKRVF